MNKYQVRRLVELANVLDEKGFHKMADEIDGIADPAHQEAIESIEKAKIYIKELEAIGRNDIAEFIAYLVEFPWPEWKSE